MISTPARGDSVVVAPSPPPTHLRLIVAIAGGIAAALLLRLYLDARPEFGAADFTYPWRAARLLIGGLDPYQHMPVAPYAQGGPFLYPLHAAVLALPFARLPASLAAAVFFGLSTLALVYALTSSGWWRLLALLSPSFLLSFLTANWPPLITASALVPALSVVGVAKPNLGLVAFAYSPRWHTIASWALVTAVTLAIIPRWPLEWLEHLGLQPAKHWPPIMWPFGFVGLVGVLRWRLPEGRLLAAMTLMPVSTLPYDHLLLWLIPRSPRESIAISALAWLAYLVVLATAPHDLKRDPRPVQTVLALGILLPLAIMVVRRRNIGSMPAWVERIASVLPSHLRGAPDEPQPARPVSV